MSEQELYKQYAELRNKLVMLDIYIEKDPEIRLLMHYKKVKINMKMSRIMNENHLWTNILNNGRMNPEFPFN